MANSRRGRATGHRRAEPFLGIDVERRTVIAAAPSSGIVVGPGSPGIPGPRDGHFWDSSESVCRELGCRGMAEIEQG